MGVVENLREEATGVLSLLILGAGFLAMFVPELSPVPFWVIWVVGFAVVLPLFAIAVGEHDSEETRAHDQTDATDEGDEVADALEELKRRYARGEFDEAEFETRLERLLETEDVAAAREYAASERRTDRTRRETE